MTELVSNRVLNRTLLDRQHLLRRTTHEIPEVVEHLVGLQAQDVMPPFVGLWSRIENFDPDVVSEALDERRLCRITLMRGTIHLVTANDALRLRPHFASMLERGPFRPGFFFGATVGMDKDDVRNRAMDLFASGPKKTSEIRDWAKEQWPDREAAAVVQAMYYLLPLLQTPPRGKWKQNNRPVWTLVEDWLQSPMVADYQMEEIVMRYLCAFGPASTMDMQAWSRLKGFREVVERLGSRLRTYTDERGRTLYDTEDGVLISGDVEAPVRFLGWYDNVALSHDDRARILDDSAAVGGPEQMVGQVSTFLLDGRLAGSYKVHRDKNRATLRISPGRPITATERRDLELEGERLLMFVEPESDQDIEFLAT